jgi:hypothetical protein
MVQHKSRILSVVIGAFFLLLVTTGVCIFRFLVYPMDVNDIWEKENLEGKIITVRGDIIFEPLSDFRFNQIYIMDSETPIEYRSPSYAFWFGMGIDGVSCSLDKIANIATCEPFDPSLATTFEFKGTIQLERIGKKEIMWLSNIDFEQSRQLRDGKWQPVPLGKFIIPLEKD